MDSASEKSIIALDNWLQSPAGAYVRAFEQACLDELTADIFGFNAIQIGVPQIDALAANRMPNKWQAATRTSTADELAYAAGGKQMPKKDLAMMAMTSRNCRSPPAASIWWCCPMCSSSPPSRTRSCAKSNGS